MPAFTTRPEIRGTFGVVASTHWLASAVGMSVLEKGGNAFDAAVAAGFTLQVVEPHLNGPLGEAPILVWSAEEPPLRHDLRPGRGAAGGDDRPLPRARARPDPRHRAARRDGARRVRRLDAAVARLRHDAARRRFWRRRSAMPRTATRSSAASARRSRPSPSCSAANGRPRPRSICRTAARRSPGRLFRNPALAATYKRVLAEAEAGGGDRERRIDRARDAWYRGFVAEAIDRSAARRRCSTRRAGAITAC